MTGTPALDDLVTEILNNYRRGRILVAVDGPEARSRARFADALAAALRAGGRSVVRQSAGEPEQYRAGEDDPGARDIVRGFRAGEPDDEMLILDGRFLLRPRLRGAWHFRIWLEGDIEISPEALSEQIAYVRDEDPRGAADAIYDVTHADAPKRVWSDSC